MEPTDGTFQKLRELAQNLWWSWQPDIRAIFRELDPELWRLVYHNPVALLQRVSPDERSPAGCRTWRCRPASTRPTAGCRSYLKGGESWGLDPRRAAPGPARRLLLGRVRAPPVAAHLLRRPGRARRRPPEEHERPRRAGGRRRPALPPGLRPPAHRRERLAAGPLRADRPAPSCRPIRAGSATPTASRSASASSCRAATSSCGSGSVRVGPQPPAAARRPRRRQLARRPGAHRPPLRRRPGDAHPAGDPARRGRLPRPGRRGRQARRCST